MSKKLSIVGIQTIPSTDTEANLANALKLVDEAFETYKHVDVLVIPEYFYRVVLKDEVDSVGAYPDEIKKAFSQRAKKHSCYIIAGTVANRKEDGKVYNTALVFDRNGEVCGEYSKTHLFDVLDAIGGVKESDIIARGDKLAIIDTDFGKIGIIICYDIRFPELARTLALKGVKYLFVPSAFFSPRSDHWQDILKVTALHNSMYVMGVNLFGKLNETSVFCGRSIIADPWGVGIATASDKAGIIQSYIDPDYPDTIRNAVGSFHNRVPELYEIGYDIG